MRSNLLVIALFALAGCDPDYTCGTFVYSEAEGRCVCPPGFVENDDFTECLSLDAGPSDGGVIADAAPIIDADLSRDAHLSDAGASCTEGATMPCGTSDVGECAFGTQECVSGAWGACEGAVEPATEACNERDDDCDGESDEGVRTTYYRDVDGDGYGVEGDSLIACTAPSGYAARAGDCLDTNASVNPGQTSFFTAPIAGVPDAARYDYDCDGTEMGEHMNSFLCSDSSGTCTVAGGFMLIIGTPPPACGESRDNFITDCSPSCETNFETRTQGCR